MMLIARSTPRISSRLLRMISSIARMPLLIHRKLLLQVH